MKRLASVILFASPLALSIACGSGEDGGASGGAQGGGAPDASAGGTGASAGASGQAGGAGQVGIGGDAGAAGQGGASGTGGSAGMAGAGGSAGAAGGTGGSAGASGSAGTGATGGGGASGGTGGSPMPTCGDGTRNQSWEQCDGADLGGASCAGLVGSSYAGTVTCSGDCTYNTQGCVCVPSCSGKECGADGCGSTCGSCDTYETCNAGQCDCIDTCAGKQCGTNLCGESCGQCTPGDTCYNGQCVAACSPNCVAKVCGTDGCGDVCGTCSVQETCSGGQCAACTKSCPTLTPAAPSSSTVCVARIDDCNACGPASCGTPHYAYGCWNGETPALAGCYKTTSNEYCCPQAACLRYTVADSYCSALGLPPTAYSCKPGISPGGGCVLYPSNSDGPVHCCSQ